MKLWLVASVLVACAVFAQPIAAQGGGFDDDNGGGDDDNGGGDDDNGGGGGGYRLRRHLEAVREDQPAAWTEADEAASPQMLEGAEYWRGRNWRWRHRRDWRWRRGGKW